MDMNNSRMYNEFAHLWTLISDPAEYANEASYWRDALRRELGPGRHEILELGVGGGNNLSLRTSGWSGTRGQWVERSDELPAGTRVEYTLGRFPRNALE